MVASSESGTVYLLEEVFEIIAILFFDFNRILQVIRTDSDLTRTSLPSEYCRSHDINKFLVLHLTTMKRSTAAVLRNCGAGARHLRRRLSTAVPPDVQVTTLPNRIRVATNSTPVHFSSVGLFVDAGSRYETPETLGVSNFINRMAFKVGNLFLFEPLSRTPISALV